MFRWCGESIQIFFSSHEIFKRRKLTHLMSSTSTTSIYFLLQFKKWSSGSPGLVVMDDNLCLRGCGFESRRGILDGHFFTLICCKNCIFRLNKTENKRNRGRGWPIFWKKKSSHVRPLFHLVSAIKCDGKINVKNMHLVSNARIQTHDFLIVGRLSKPQSLPTTLS